MVQMLKFWYLNKSWFHLIPVEYQNRAVVKAGALLE